MKVKIGYLTYEVREVPYIEVNGNEAANGEADYEKIEIQIRKALLHPKKREVLLHEILHCVCVDGNIELSENEIEVLAAGLTRFLVDNISLVKKEVLQVEREAIDNKVKK